MDFHRGRSFRRPAKARASAVKVMPPQKDAKLNAKASQFSRSTACATAQSPGSKASTWTIGAGAGEDGPWGWAMSPSAPVAVPAGAAAVAAWSCTFVRRRC